jgi:RNA polymerase sigma-70 factor (ECF subfamily)
MNRKRVGAETGDGRDWLALHQLASGITHRVLKNHNDAEDAAQEAVLRAYRAVSAGSTPADIHAWLATIARREAYRLHGRTKPTITVEEASVEATAMADPSDVTVDRLTARQWLSESDGDAREIILRRYGLNQSSSEIAGEMEMPASTVRVKLHRALSQMRKSYEQS